MIEERYDLAIGRIGRIGGEESVKLPFRNFFQKAASFLLMIDELKKEIERGEYEKRDLSELEAWNDRLYRDILPDNYSTSYGNPVFAVKELGEGYGQILSFLYTELRGAIPYVFEGKTEYLDILLELFLEIYGQFEEEEIPKEEQIKEIITGMPATTAMCSWRTGSRSRSTRTVLLRRIS